MTEPAFFVLLGMVLIDPPAVYCMLVVIAGMGCLVGRVVPGGGRSGCGSGWPLALAVLAAAAVTLRLSSLSAFTQGLSAAERSAPTVAGLAQAGAALAAAAVLAILAARDLRRVPAGPIGPVIRP
jgi:hypothetical protein